MSLNAKMSQQIKKLNEIITAEEIARKDGVERQIENLQNIFEMRQNELDWHENYFNHTKEYFNARIKAIGTYSFQFGIEIDEIVGIFKEKLNNFVMGIRYKWK